MPINYFFHLFLFLQLQQLTIFLISSHSSIRHCTEIRDSSSPVSNRVKSISSSFALTNLSRFIKKEKNVAHSVVKKKKDRMRCVTLMATARNISSSTKEGKTERKKGKNLAYTWITIHLEEEEAAFSAVDNATYTRIYFIHSLYSRPYSILFHFVTSPILFHFGPWSLFVTTLPTVLGNYVTHSGAPISPRANANDCS